MGSEWAKSNWGDEVSLQYGKAIRGYQNAKGRYRVFGSNGPIGWTSKPLAQGPGVILGRKGACRGVEFSKEPFFVIDTAYYVQPKKNLEMRWLYYAIKHHKLGEINDGSPIPSTTRAAVYVRDLSVPPLPEQRAIAHVLGSLDDKIELNRKMNATLEAMAQALFKSWFVDFDPVIDNALDAGNPIPEELQARAAARESLGEARKPLPEDIQKLFPDSFQHTEELGWIPQGWEVGKMSDLATLNPTSWTGKNAPSKVHYIDLANVKNGRISDVASFAFKDAPSRARRILHVGDTVIGTVRPGNRSFALIQDDGLTGSTGFAVMRPNLVRDVEFTYLCLTQNTVIDHFAHLADGAAYPAINASVVAGLQIVLPPEPFLEAFHHFTKPWLMSVGARERSNRDIARTRDTLLPKLLSGEFRLPLDEFELEEAL